MKLHRMALAASAAAVVLVLSACTGGTPTSETSGGTLVFATGEPDHLTPGRQTVAFDQVLSLFSPLVSIDENNELVYVQAESVTSDDATHWTITLRPGWTFHNGEPVTAESYVNAWNTVAYAPNAWANSGQLSSIVGFDALNPAEGEPSVEELSGLALVDELTFTVELVAPDSQFPLQLSSMQTAFYPMPAAAFDDLEAYDRQPIGNGPFEMTAPWVENQEFTVTAYEDYAGEAPLLDGVTFRSYSDMATGYTDVLAGNADVLLVPTSKLTSAGADFGDRFVSFEAPGVDFIGFPLTDPRYQSTELRQAISMSIDREAINDAIYGGIYEPATSLTSSGMAGDPAGVCGEYCEFDPDAAKELLAKIGGFDGNMELIYPGAVGLDALYEAYANQIRQNLGIDTVVATPTTDWAEYYDLIVGGTVSGPHFGHWGALYPSQQNTLRALYTSTGDCFACTQYSSPEVDALLVEADAATSIEEANGIYEAAQKAILRDFPTVPTFSNKYPYVMSERVSALPAISGSVVLSKVELGGN